MAGDIRDNIAAIRSDRAPAIVRARQNGIKFAANHLFDQPTNPVTDPCFDRWGRIEARFGLRMMPTFPRSPLSFRTASFPQYGWKADCPSGAFLGDWRLKPAPGIRRPPSSLHPLFVHFVVATAVRSESGLRTRSCTAMRWNTPPTPGALARVRVVVSRSVIT